MQEIVNNISHRAGVLVVFTSTLFPINGFKKIFIQIICHCNLYLFKRFSPAAKKQY